MYRKRALSKHVLFASISVPIASIKEVREGFTTDAFTQCPEVYTESLCFSIIHGDDFSTLDLVFPTQEECLHWTVGLRYLLAKKSGTVHVYSAKAIRTFDCNLVPNRSALKAQGFHELRNGKW